MYKEIVSEKEFDGTLGSLIEKIVEAFVDEEISQSKLGEFHVMAGVVDIEDYGCFTFHDGLTGFDRDYVLEEEVIRAFIMERLSGRAAYESTKLDIDSNIKATYTLACS